MDSLFENSNEPKEFDIIAMSSIKENRDLNAQKDLLETDGRNVNEVEKLFQLLYDRKLKDFVEYFSSLKSTIIEEVRNCNDGNYTFLQYATLNELTVIARVLLVNGADPNLTTDFEKHPPIIIASMRKNYEILKMFFEFDKNKRLDVDCTDTEGNTALHYASKNEDLKSVIELMRQGANITQKNMFGMVPFPAKSVECFLDKSLKTNNLNPKDEEYKIIFDYSFLLAHRKQSTKRNVCQTLFKNLSIQNEVGIQNTNTEYHNSEMDFLLHLSKSDNYRELMKHPVVSTFINIKWQSARIAFYINLFIYIIFVLLLNFYILSRVGQVGTNKSDISSIILTTDHSARFFIGSFLAYSAGMESTHFVASPKMYCKNYENLINVGFLLVTGYILFCSDWNEPFVVLAIISSWSKLIFLTGKHPKLSRNIEMLKNVSGNYCWFLFSYIFLIVGFAFSFYSLHHMHINNSPGQNSTVEYVVPTKDNKNYDFFSNPWLSILKTFIMMMGEFESSEFLPQISSFQTFFWLFSFFVFIIGMVLFNLLTFLAISEIDAIKVNADNFSLISRIRLIHKIESVILLWQKMSMKFRQWKLFKPFFILMRFFFRNFTVFPNNSRPNGMMYNMLLGTDTAPSSKLMYVMPNKGLKIIRDSNEQKNSYDITSDIYKDTVNIINNRDKVIEAHNVSVMLDDLKEAVKEIHKTVYEFQERMDDKLAELRKNLAKPSS